MNARTSRRRGPAVAAAVIVVAVAIAGIGLLARPGPVAAPASSPAVASGSPVGAPGSAPGGGAAASAGSTSGPVVAMAPDLPPLAADGEISEADLAHDSRDDLYRTPFGAAPAGSTITLRIRAAAGDLTDATVRVWDALQQLQVLVPMKVVATDRTAGQHGYDYWQAQLHTLAQPTVLYYRFIVRDGSATRYLENQLPADGGSDEGNAGGPGRVYEASPDSSWQVDLYKPDFTTPAWARGAVVYQVFPDRFANGDPSNDPSPTASPGTSGAARYRSGTVYGNPVLVKGWSDLPEGSCRAYQGVACAEQPLGRDFFGGDLAGIIARLDDLADLGVTAIYLNPIFAAPSNHRYDTADYRVVDPDLGTNADFVALASAARARGIRIILDGVFNHVSSDSPYFDRYHHYQEVGACESASSPYRSWFTFRKPAANEPSPCAPSKPGGDDTYYVGWASYDTIPELVEQPDVNGMFTGPDGITSYWLGQGASAWRLDVMDNLSHGFMRSLRSSIKAADPDALIIGEQWHDTSAWLLGNEADTTMNYRFRRAVIGFINGPTADLDGAIAGLSPSQFSARMAKVREDYPAPAFDALLNLVDSHDTTRILWTLTPGADNAAAREAPGALAQGKEKLRQLATLQLTWPGMASIYYGDEVGLTGQDDPDDRRPYPTANPDEALRTHYRALARLRAAHAALREGDLRFLLADDGAGILAFGRRAADEAAVTVINVSATEQTVSVPVADYVPDGAVLESGLGGSPATVANGSLAITLPPRGSAVYLTRPGFDLAPPEAPADLSAAASPGSVALAWTPVTGAARYRVLRSLVAGGGFEVVGTTEGAGYTDATPRNGTPYLYAVVALDEAGNVGPRSPEASALPSLKLADARLEGPDAVQQPLSAVDPGVEIAGRVRVSGVTGGTAPAIGILAQLGFGRAGADPAGPDWSWSTTTWSSGVDGADRIVGSVRPEAAGTYDLLLRVSTDGGGTWAYAGLGGVGSTGEARRAVVMTAVRGADAVAPPAPGAPRATVVGPSSVTLAWAPVSAPDLLRYVVWRATDAGGPYAAIGSTSAATFTDDTVSAGATYRYVVTAEDTSFNRSANSPELNAAAQSRDVQVTFRVTVPKGTPKGDIALHRGRLPGLEPGHDGHDQGGRDHLDDHGAVRGGPGHPVQVHPGQLGRGGEGRRLQRAGEPDAGRRLQRRRDHGRR